MMDTTGGVGSQGRGAPSRAKALHAGPLSAKQQEIVLVVRKTDPGLKDLLRQIRGRYRPNKTWVVVDRTEEVGLEKVPAAVRGKTALDGKPTAYVCHNFTCSQPVTEWAALEMLL